MEFTAKDFVHWHVHSCYSRFDGLAKLSDLVMETRKRGHPALALTDHGNIMGWMYFIKECRMTKTKKGEDIPYDPIKPILGSEMYLSRHMDIGQKDSSSRGKERRKKEQPEGRKGNRHINLYAMNYEGYKNLCTLSQRSWTEGFYSDPRIDIEMIDKHSKGLMAGSACLSSIINFNLVQGRYEEAKKICGLFKEIFDSNFFLEVMYHGIPEQKQIISSIFQLSDELDIPVIATNDCHYLRKDQASSQELLMCMSTNKCIKDPTRVKHAYEEFYLKTVDEMASIFGGRPECLTNSIMMMERIDDQDIEKNLFGGMRLPKFDIPPEYKDSYDYLCFLAWEGLKKVGWAESKEHVNTLKMELEDIRVARDNNNYDFAKYFLIVQDYINEARKRGCFIGSGRGSGYASILLRCLGITYGVDPLKYSLIWERFLGFDNKKFIKKSDFGFKEDIEINVLKKNVLDTNRDLEDDMGGVDRY
ncbi:MAG: PHP domain-containing protein [Clostridiales bacterium]|nr:PHP domain-containing protein [Clostridiales bacterium]